MKKLNSAELRSAYLNFFKERGHAVIGSASLIPENDPTVLFTTAGMHPLVPYLSGEKLFLLAKYFRHHFYNQNINLKHHMMVLFKMIFLISAFSSFKITQ